MSPRARVVVFVIITVIIGPAAYFGVSELWPDVKLTVYDQLARPGEKGEVIAKLEQVRPLGHKTEMGGYPVRFWGPLFNVTEVNTGANGVARARVEFSSNAYGPGKFNAEFAGEKYRNSATASGSVFLWSADALILVADIDHLISDPDRIESKPALPDAAEVLTGLNKTYHIVYLTACDGSLFDRTKAWLKENGFPDGPCFCRDFYPSLSQEGFKQQFVTDLKRRFRGTWVGVGDRESAANAYLASGLQAFIIDPEKQRDLPKQAVRVGSWKEIAERLR